MKHFLNTTYRWLLALIAIFAMSTTAIAQNTGNGSVKTTFRATGTINGTYTTSYESLCSNFPLEQASTAPLDVTNAAGAKVATATVALDGYDVTFTVSGATTTADGNYTFTVPQGYFTVDIWSIGVGPVSSQTFTIVLSNDADEPETIPGTHFDFTQKASLTTTIDDITLVHNGNYQSARSALQLNNGKTATITAPEGYNITRVVLVNTTQLALSGSVQIPTLATLNADRGTFADFDEDAQTRTWTGSTNTLTFTSTSYTYVGGFYVVIEADPTVDLKHFTLTKACFSPSPDDDITIGSILAGEYFNYLRITAPAGVAFQEPVWKQVDAKFNGTKTTFPCTLESDNVLLVGGIGIQQNGTYTFEFPEGTFYSTKDKTNQLVTLTYNVGTRHYKYNVSLTAGGDPNAIPADATITVAGQPYAKGSVVSSIAPLEASDVQADIDGYILQNVEVVQPTVTSTTTYNGLIHASYEKIIPRLDYSGLTPALGTIDLDNAYFQSICISFPEAPATDITTAPLGFSFIGPDGYSVPLSEPYGFTFWASGQDLYINFPSQQAVGTYTLTIPADAITFASGIKNKAITLQWQLKAKYFQFERNDNYDTAKSFSVFRLVAPEGVTLESTTLTALKRYMGYDEANDAPIYANVPVSVNLSGRIAEFVLTTPITTKSYVSLEVPEGTITTTDGRTNRQAYYSQDVDPMEYIGINGCWPASHNYDIAGPLSRIVLTLDREVADADVQAFLPTITINGNNVTVNATVNGDKLTINFDPSYILYDAYNQFCIPEGFITTRSGAINRVEWINNIWVNSPREPLEFTGVQAGYGTELLTTTGAKVEKVGIIIIHFAEEVQAASGADFTSIVVTDNDGNVCPLYQGQGWLNGNNTFTLWVYPDRTDIGTYNLHVPAGLFEGTESGNVNEEINFQLVISDVSTYATPASSIAEGATVDALTELVLTAPAGVYFSHFTDYPADFFYLTGPGITGDGMIRHQATISDDGKTATFRLGNHKADGDYTITIPRGYLRSTFPNEGNAEITIHVKVSHYVDPWDADDNGTVDATDVTAAANALLNHTNSYGNDNPATHEAALKALDLNNDGEITIGEITKLIQQLTK